MHTIESAASGRSKCRGCNQAIAKDSLRFGERLPNPFADGEMTHWYHIDCAAFRRPHQFAEVINEYNGQLDTGRLTKVVEQGQQHERLERLCGAERAPSGRARCRACRQTIDRDHWRLALQYFEETGFNPAGYIHISCAGEYFGTALIMDRVRHFAASLSTEELTEIESSLNEQ